MGSYAYCEMCGNGVKRATIQQIVRGDWGCPYCCHDMPLKDTPLNLLAEYVEEMQEQIEMLKRQIEGMTGDGL